MQNLLLVNGHQYWERSPGKLNQLLVQAVSDLLSKNYNITCSHVEKTYHIKEEIDKYLHADAIIFLTPVYWMSVPWMFKKYIDEVYMAGQSIMFLNDGRDKDIDKKYGSGGLLKNKKYMLTTTWNAPAKAFNPQDKDQLFKGKTVDEIFSWFHAAQNFIGMETLPSFHFHDVIKNPSIEQDMQNFTNHLKSLFL